MAKLYLSAFALFCVLVALPRCIDAKPTYLPEVPTTPYPTLVEDTPYPPDTPSTPGSPETDSEPPTSIPEYPCTPSTPDSPEPPETNLDVHYRVLRSVRETSGDNPQAPEDPTGECEEKPDMTDDPCVYCWCFDGEWACVPEECGILPCVDPSMKDGQCCPTCPNGPNCKIDGHVVPIGETIQVPDGECTCQGENDFGQPGIACRPKRNNCTHEMKDIACGYCWCDESSGDWICLDRPCTPALCVDVVPSEDGCCDECPNGYNCEAFGQIIPWGEVKTLFNGFVCACEWNSPDLLKAQCKYVPEPNVPTDYYIYKDYYSNESPPDSPSEEIPEDAP